MSKRRKIAWVIAIVAVLVAAAAMVGDAIAQKTVPKPQDKLAIGESEVRQLLLLMDTDKRGKISKQDYLKFMEAEFARLDKGKTGELDVKQLTQPNLYAARFVGK
jgi:hypothetical protein